MRRGYPNVSLRGWPRSVAHSWRTTPSVSPYRRAVRIAEAKRAAAETKS